ncbi:MAG: hypothetical protein WDM80_17660 [Limisphaerales bacterium]
MELLALVLLVTAATGPHWKVPQSTRPLIVILDDSFSMRAIHSDESAQLRAEKYLEKMFRPSTAAFHSLDSGRNRTTSAGPRQPGRGRK